MSNKEENEKRLNESRSIIDRIRNKFKRQKFTIPVNSIPNQEGHKTMLEAMVRYGEGYELTEKIRKGVEEILLHNSFEYNNAETRKKITDEINEFLNKLDIEYESEIKEVHTEPDNIMEIQ